MRILHTADWHIGQTLNGWSRDHEHRTFLARLPELVTAHDVDALVVAGDVFDGINPSAEALQMLYETLAALRAARPHLTTVMVAGNHDPAGRLEAPAALLRPIGVHVAGVIHRRDGALDLARHLVPLRDPAGEVRAFVLAIPYLRAADLPHGGTGDREDADAGSPVVRGTRDLYAEATVAARAAAGRLPLIATGHLHCAGALESEGAERRILVGGEHAVPHDVFPADLAYVALGHLHRPQHVGRDSVRYSGSPFPLSATELPYRHGATLVDLHPDGTRNEHIPLARPVPCVRIPETGVIAMPSLPDAIAALSLDPACPRDRQPFVHVALAAEGAAAGLAGEVERLLAEHPLRSAGVRIERPGSDVTEAVAPPSRSLVDCDPVELFGQAFEATHGRPPEDAHRVAFEQARAED